jgi:putative ABC transport system permease protein
MRTRLIAGRTFTDGDNTLETANRIVIDDLVAAQAYPIGTAVGKTLLVRNMWGGGPDAPTNVEMEVIGVVAHQRHETLAEPGREAIFFVDARAGFGSPRWIVRTTGDPSAITPAVTAAIAEIDGRVPVSEALPYQWYVDKANGPTRFATTLIGIFAAIAVVLAAVGLYGVLATTVRQRTAEIGMRMVCGAEPAGVLRLVLTEGLQLSLAGMALGLVAALSMTGLIRSMLVSVTPTDPATFVAISVLFITIVAVSSLIPALRASRVDPVTAIRHQ